MKLVINGQPYDGELSSLHLEVQVAPEGESVGPCSLLVTGGHLEVRCDPAQQDGIGVRIEVETAWKDGANITFREGDERKSLWPEHALRGGRLNGEAQLRFIGGDAFGRGAK